MTQESKTNTTYRYLHLSADELAVLPPAELLQACLEAHQLLNIIKGVLYTPDTTLILRAVTLDLLFSEAERLSQQEGARADTPATYDIKTVSDKLGIRPTSIRTAYEQLESLGGVQIVAKQFPRTKQKQLPFEESGESKEDN